MTFQRLVQQFSFADGIGTRPGDRFEIAACRFVLRLCNPLEIAPEMPVTVRAL